MRRRYWWAAGTALAGAALWPIVTSAIYGVPGGGPMPSVSNPAPIYQAWVDRDRDDEWKLGLAGAAGGALCLYIPGMLLFAQPRRRLRAGEPGEPTAEPLRAASSTHGNAHWCSEEEAKRLFPGPHPAHGGVVIGQTSGGDLLVEPCTEDSGHGVLFGGSGSGKTAGVTIPTLNPAVGWRGGCVVLDPSCRVGPMTRDMREAFGQRVVMLGPGLQGFNVLDWIDPADPLAEVHVRNALDLILTTAPKLDGDNAMFAINGRRLLLAVLADMLWDETIPKAERTLRLFASRLAVQNDELRETLGRILEHSASRLARHAAAPLVAAHTRTFDSIVSNATASVEWLTIGPYADLVSGSDMTLEEFQQGNVTVYVQLGLDTLIGDPAVGRTVVNALLQAVYRLNGSTPARFLFLLDEIDKLGAMKPLKIALETARQYRVSIVGMWQSMGQMTDTWGQGGKKSWMESSSWQAYASITDPEDAKELSRRCGSTTILAQSESRSRGSSTGSSSSGLSISISEQPHLLIRDDQIQTEMASDERIVFRKRASGPIRCRAALWFRRADMITVRPWEDAGADAA